MNKTVGIAIFVGFLFLCFLAVIMLVAVIALGMQGSTPTLFQSDQIAVVRVAGTIISGETWIEEINDYAEDSSIKAILVEFDSGGGAVVGSQNLYNAMKSAREDHGKPVVAYFNSVAASGAYYAACGADVILSAPGAMTGSIGVYISIPEAETLLETIGVDFQTVKAGRFKNFGSIAKPLDGEETDMLQAMVDDIYNQFIEAVAAGRADAMKSLIQTYSQETHGDEFPFSDDVLEVIETYQRDRDRYLAQEAAAAAIEGSTDVTVGDALENYQPDTKTVENLVRALSEGKVYTGRQAESVGLVDGVGDFDDAVDLAAQLSGIRGEPTLVERIPPEMTLLDLLSANLNTLLGAENLNSPLRYESPF